jgi:hypothetical protein
MRLLIRRRVVLVIGSLSAASAGCSILADLSQFNGYTDASAGDGGGLDSSSDSPGVGPDEAGDEGSDDGAARDAGDAAVDGVAPGDAPGGDAPNPLGTSWCSVNVDQATVLCADWDEGRADSYVTYEPCVGTGCSANNQQWNLNQVGGTDGLDRADYALGSAPASLDIETVCTGGTGADCQSTTASQLQFIQTVTAPHGVVFSFALKIPNFDLNATDVSLVTLGNGGDWRLSLDYAGGTNPNSDNQFLEIHTDDAGVSTITKTVISFPDFFTNPCLSSGDAGTEGGVDPADAGDAGDGGICIGGWINFEMMVDLLGTSATCVSSGGPCATVTYDGQNAIVGGGTVIPISPPTLASWQVLIGANYIQAPAQPMSLHYDNVKVEALP